MLIKDVYVWDWLSYAKLLEVSWDLKPCPWEQERKHSCVLFSFQGWKKDLTTVLSSFIGYIATYPSGHL